jgi:transposase
MPLPPYAPELNPVEQLWLNIKSEIKAYHENLK